MRLSIALFLLSILALHLHILFYTLQFSPGVLTGSKAMKFAFIEQHRQAFSVQQMCQVLGVSSSGYYAFRKRKPSIRSKKDQCLPVHVRAAHRASRETYGVRRIYHELQAQGIDVGVYRIRRLMREAGLKVKSRRPYKVTTKRDSRLPIRENILNREFGAKQPDRKWVADFTYIATDQGWLYLATVMDLFSRKIVGWSMQPRMSKARVKDALEMALMRRCPQAGLLHHSDQGSQYASFDYQKVLADHCIQVSMSRTGNCYDNAVIESFFATLKTECIDRRYPTRDDARRSLFDYIEVWYNRSRRHSSLDYLSPDEYERLHYRDKIILH